MSRLDHMTSVVGYGVLDTIRVTWKSKVMGISISNALLKVGFGWISRLLNTAKGTNLNQSKKIYGKQNMTQITKKAKHIKVRLTESGYIILIDGVGQQKIRSYTVLHSSQQEPTFTMWADGGEVNRRTGTRDSEAVRYHFEKLEIINEAV